MQPQILRRVIALTEKTQGFTVDGKPLLALFSCEKQGKNYALNFTSSNLSRLVEGEYFITLAGEKEETLRFAPQTTAPMQMRGDLGADNGLAVFIWTEQNGAPVPVAFGMSGRVKNHQERVKGEVLRVLRSPVYRNETPMYPCPSKTAYEDEAIATENYYAVKEKKDETNGCDCGENVTASGENRQEKQGEKSRFYTETDENVTFGQENLTSLLGDEFKRGAEENPFAESAENAFFNRKKSVILQALQEGERERALCNAVPGGYFAKLPHSPLIFGIITLKDSLFAEDLPTLMLSDVITLCYALPTDCPSAEKGKEYRYFVPIKTDGGKRGYLVTCQNPITGNPEKFSFA
ncbi:MAG: hypothetical protein E7363_03655 [Clostridiales bacterium]|nr:hypothetical protein [Clostridiales bacterium]